MGKARELEIIVERLITLMEGSEKNSKILYDYVRGHEERIRALEDKTLPLR